MAETSASETAPPPPAGPPAAPSAGGRGPRTAAQVAFDADFLKLLFAGLGFGVLMLGYSYTASFYGHLGVRTTDLDLGQLDMLFRGVALLRDWTVSLTALGVVGVFALMVAGRHLLPEWGAILAALLGFAIFVIGSVMGGHWLGASHARGIAEGRYGMAAFCLFHDPLGIAAGNDEPAETRAGQARMVERLRTFGAANPLRLVHRNDDYHYLAPPVDFASTERDSGEVYAIPNDIVASCRLVSADVYGNVVLGAGGDPADD